MMRLKYFTFLMLCILVYACSSFPYTKTNRQYIGQAKLLSKKLALSPDKQSDNELPLAEKWVGTTNFDLRKPNFVVIHHTAQNSCEQTLKTFTLERTKVSAHYVICKDGTVHHMLNDYMRAWHGGVGSWGNNTDLNSSSIGIELDNNGFEPFEQAQINSLLKLLAQLKNKYQIPVDHFIGHSDIAPRRKVDPNIHFPWKTLANLGYGIWFEPDPNIQLQSGLTIKQALSIVGYETKDSIAALLAFKRHYRQDSSRLMNQADSSVLSQLIQAKLSN
ncbi:MAG: N-acetylmuramoyl-L-alanine amidase [Chitinophagia bacterium]